MMIAISGRPAGAGCRAGVLRICHGPIRVKRKQRSGLMQKVPVATEPFGGQGRAGPGTASASGTEPARGTGSRQRKIAPRGFDSTKRNSRCLPPKAILSSDDTFERCSTPVLSEGRWLVGGKRRHRARTCSGLSTLMGTSKIFLCAKCWTASSLCSHLEKIRTRISPWRSGMKIEIRVLDRHETVA